MRHTMACMATSPVLEGYRIVSLALNVPGPLACARLVQLGAHVLKLEPPTGDPLAQFCPEWYRQISAGQEVVRYDLKSEDGRAFLKQALRDADLLLTSMRPAALQRLSLDRGSLQSAFPHLSHVAIFGHSAPAQDRAGHDLTYQAGAGLLLPPGMPATLLADLVGAERAVSGALQLLLARARGSTAGYLEVALSESAAYLATPRAVGLTAPGGPLGGADPCYRLYETAAGWIAVAALEPHFRSRMLEELSCEATAAELERAFLERTAAEWERWGAARDLPITVVRDAAAFSTGLPVGDDPPTMAVGYSRSLRPERIRAGECDATDPAGLPTNMPEGR